MTLFGKKLTKVRVRLKKGGPTGQIVEVIKEDD